MAYHFPVDFMTVPFSNVFVIRDSLIISV